MSSDRRQALWDLERRVLNNRQELLNLSAGMEQASDELADMKVRQLEQELAAMSRQLSVLRQVLGEEVSAADSAAERQSAADAASVAKREANIPGETGRQQTQPAYGRNSGENSSTNRNPVRAAASAINKPLPGKKDLEKTVGSSLMGILASVLIFISLILFATLLLPYFNDTAKMITTYVVSFAFLGVGMFLSSRDANNKFYIALIGCGMGALYISLLLSNMYFKMIGDLVLFALIAVWGVGACVLARKKGRLFAVIGETGTSIAVLLGCILCASEGDEGRFIALIAFTLVASVVFLVGRYSGEFKGNVLRYSFHTVNLLLLYIFGTLLGSKGVLTDWLLLAFTAASFAVIYMHELTGLNALWGAFSLAYLGLGLGKISSLLPYDRLPETIDLVMALLCLGGIAFYEIKSVKSTGDYAYYGKYIGEIGLFALACGSLQDERTLMCAAGIVLLTVVPFAIGFLRKNPVMKAAGLVGIVLYMMTRTPYGDTGVWWDGLKIAQTGAALLAGFGFMLFFRKEQYSRVFKYALHLLTVIYFFPYIAILSDRFKVDEIVILIITYALAGLFNIGALKSSLANNLKTGEKESPLFYNIINSIAMIAGLILYALYPEGITHIVLILTTLAVFTVNAKNLLDKRDRLLMGIYVGIKYTVLMIVILHSFDAVNYVISISCLLISILAIVLGFIGKYKALRIFGLVLSMISIFKLIMIDISYNNTLGNALSFFVSGILCFVISLIYNYIDRKFSAAE